MKIKNFTLLLTLSFLSCSAMMARVTTLEETNDINSVLNETPSEIGRASLSTFFQADEQDGHARSADHVTAQFDKVLKRYITDHYNAFNYADIISQDAQHLLTLLKTIKSIDLGEDKIVYSYTVCKLFNDKIKQAELVDATTLNQILKALPSLVGDYFAKQEEDLSEAFTRMQEHHQSILLSQFTNHLPLSQDTAENRALELTNGLFQTTATHVKSMLVHNEEKIRFQQMIVRLLENVIGRSCWSLTNYESFTPSLIETADGVLSLVKTGVLDHIDDYDSIMWSLTHRAAYFLNLTTFPLDFYQHLESQLNFGEIQFLEEEEQDSHIKSKKELFVEALTKAKIQAFAYQRAGILPDPTI